VIDSTTLGIADVMPVTSVCLSRICPILLSCVVLFACGGTSPAESGEIPSEENVPTGSESGDATSPEQSPKSAATATDQAPESNTSPVGSDPTDATPDSIAQTDVGGGAAPSTGDATRAATEEQVASEDSPAEEATAAQDPSAESDASSSQPTSEVPTASGGSAPGIVGFASIVGHGREGTNGGSDGQTVTVQSFDELVAAVSDDVPRTVQISGTITSTTAEMIDVGSNKTLIGLGSDATIDGFGFDINGWTGVEVEAFGKDTCEPEYREQFPHVQNVIVRNLTFINAADDSVNVQCYSHHVWIDHNHFFTAYDGSIDIKRGSDLVTVSWNRFTDTDKTMLLGHSEKNGEQDRGYLRATYHHNFFDNTNTRTPRVRFGMAHVFNNYLASNDYFLGLGIEANIYAEANYIERSKTLTQIFSESEGYNLTWADSNHYDQTTITRAQDSKKTMIDWLDANGAVNAPTDYEYSTDAASEVAASVPSGAGVGHL
jgi:pectate lyase